jgi:hypothetical protein
LPTPVLTPVELAFHDLSDENLETLGKRGRKFYVSDSEDDEDEMTASIKKRRVEVVHIYSIYNLI